MSTTRDFSDSIKFEAVKDNLKRNNGTICCETCKKKLLSIDECHFDHIYPYAKGGKSNFENCQILCIDCNLEKNDKELKDFVLEKQAKQFLSGTQITEVQEEVLESTDKTFRRLLALRIYQIVGIERVLSKHLLILLLFTEM